MNRRHFLIGTSASVISLGFLKPKDESGPYPLYFKKLNQVLKNDNLGRPGFIIDQSLLDQNINYIRSLVPADKSFRLVVKSLSCVQLLTYLSLSMKTQRFMVFDLAHLKALINVFPEGDFLFGKPMLTTQVHHFYTWMERNNIKNNTKIQWLIDTKTRLIEYLHIAKVSEVNLQCNLEIDIGLHRGGFTNHTDFKEALDLIADNQDALTFSGLMGYDAHVVKLPSIIASSESLFAKSQKRYQSFIDQINSKFPQLDLDTLCLNSAGSPTLLLHCKKTTVANDLSAGSCFLKPDDFDVDTLAGCQTSAYIATPILKKGQALRLPGLNLLNRFLNYWDPNLQTTYFVYGGLWQGQFVAPLGIRENGIYGTSSNQHLITAGGSTNIGVSDFIFIKPNQSEKTIQLFKEITLIEKNKTLKKWPTIQVG